MACTYSHKQQFDRMKSGLGFVAALDQSGGSTPKALKLYGLSEADYKNESEMFDLVHQMRTRIIKSPAFTSQKILAAILFEMTMNRTIDGIGTAEYLWKEKGIVPILKIDNGLLDEVDGVQLMKPIPELAQRLSDANSHGVFGTKMRSVIKSANPVGISNIVKQQFEFAQTILEAGLYPIIEPEVDIKAADKLECEKILKAELLKHLETLATDKLVMLKLTIPSEANFYQDLINHPKVLRVVALSGGYSRDEANSLLAKNNGLIASFSRALTEGLSAQQSDEEFNATLSRSIDDIYQASIT
ncbi:MAG: fructose bisphosphate aldolase [Actinobacteria bacterium]|nr:fructose bisphosphate aldolase [Actinomycetota bacterium]